MSTTITAGNATNGLAFSADNAGILELKTGTGSGTTALTLDASQNLQFNSGYGSIATAYGCRAWVNFNGTGTIAIRASGNVTSITDGGVGVYTVNFTNAMPNTSFAPNVSADIYTTSHATIGIDAFTTSAFRIRIEQNSAAFDPTFVCASVFR